MGHPGGACQRNRGRETALARAPSRHVGNGKADGRSWPLRKDAEAQGWCCPTPKTQEGRGRQDVGLRVLQCRGTGRGGKEGRLYSAPIWKVRLGSRRTERLVSR